MGKKFLHEMGNISLGAYSPGLPHTSDLPSDTLYISLCSFVLAYIRMFPGFYRRDEISRFSDVARRDRIGTRYRRTLRFPLYRTMTDIATLIAYRAPHRDAHRGGHVVASLVGSGVIPLDSLIASAAL